VAGPGVYRQFTRSPASDPKPAQVQAVKQSGGAELLVMPIASLLFPFSKAISVQNTL